MNFTGLKAFNFLSYKSLSFDFEEGLTLISGKNVDQGTSNGSGKSAIFDALCFCLFGKTARPIKVDELIFRGQSKMVVSVDILDGDRKISIERSRNPNSVTLLVDGVKHDAQDVSAVQREINTILGVDYALFLNSVYFAQVKSGQFLAANDEDKKGILINILGLDVFEKAYRGVHEDLKKVVVDLEKKTSAVTSLTELISQDVVRIRGLKSAAENFEEDKAKDLASIEKELDGIKEEQVIVQTKMDDTKYDEDGYNERQRVYLEADEHNDKISTCVKKQASAFAELGAMKDKVLVCREKLKVYHTNTCPECSQALPPNSNLVSIEKTKMKDLIKTYKDKQLVLNDLENIITEDNGLALKNLVKTKTDLERYADLKSVKEETVKKMSDLGSRYKDLIDRKADVEKRVNNYSTMIEEQSLIHLNRADSCGKNHSDALKIKKQIKDLELLKEIFGPQGVRALILDRVIDRLNVLTNKYLERLFDSPLQVSFSVDEKETKKTFKQRIETVINVMGIDVNFHSLSGGERRRIIIAVDLALSDIVCQRANRTFNVLFLDEATEGMDSQGREKLFDLLSHLASEKSIYVIDHANMYQSLFDRTINVEKINGESKII